MYDTYFEEYRNDNKWHILHTLGKFETKNKAVQAAKNWLTIQKIKYHENK
jgi:septal ring-binding cell division protein DamX